MSDGNQGVAEDADDAETDDVAEEADDTATEVEAAEESIGSDSSENVTEDGGNA
jgi:hypothetical protein